MSHVRDDASTGPPSSVTGSPGTGRRRAGVHNAALSALGSGFQLAYLVGAIAAAVVTLIGLTGTKTRHLGEEELVAAAPVPAESA